MDADWPLSKLSRHTRVDWFRVLSDLKRRGVSMREVARRLTVTLRGEDSAPVSEAHLRHYSNGGEPRFPVGLALLQLWIDVTGKTWGDVPLLR